jgi:Uma2 family endonuclease
MSPSKDHERVKSYIGRLVETWAFERGVDLSPYGAWTLKHAARQVGAEPDECYIIGADQNKERPDLVIEVIWTTGGIDKLEIYRRLGISEVWLWRNGAIEVYALRGDDYARVPGSRLLSDLDLRLLTSFFDRPTTLQAVRAYRDALQPPATA